MDPDLASRLTEFVEKVGLLRRDMRHRDDLEKYEGRLARIDQKFLDLADLISQSDPKLAAALRVAWQLPARSLAFRNAEHRRKPDEPAP